MDVQFEFEKTVVLLQKHEQEFPRIGLLLEQINNSTVAFTSLQDKSAPGTFKGNVSGIYQLESQLKNSQDSGSSAVDYDLLIQRLKETAHTHIALSYFITSEGTYKVFSDLDKEELFGVLVTKGTLQEERAKVDAISNIIKMAGNAVKIDDSRTKHIFIKRQYQPAS